MKILQLNLNDGSFWFPNGGLLISTCKTIIVKISQGTDDHRLGEGERDPTPQQG